MMKRFGSQKKWRVAVIAAAAVLLLGAGTTLAFLTAQADPLTNAFAAADMGVTVEETFDNETKENVAVKNDSDVPVYIRVALIPTWQDDAGNPVGQAASLSDLDISWGDGSGTDAAPGNGWIKIGSYYYYTTPVAPGESTKILMKKAVVDSATGETYHMNLQVMADAVQAMPEDAVADVWPVRVTNGVLS